MEMERGDSSRWPDKNIGWGTEKERVKARKGREYQR